MRQVKKTVSVTTGQRRKWDKESFFQDAIKRLTQKQVNSIRVLFDISQELKCELTWGAGKTAGSFSAKWPHLGKYSVFSVFSNGRLVVNFGNFRNTPEQSKFAAFLKDQLVSNLGVTVPEDYERRYPSFSIKQWSDSIEKLVEVIELALQKFPASDNI